MKPKIYMLSFDPYKTDAQALHTLVSSMPLMVEWWHYLGSTYLLTSHSTALQLQNYINSHWSGQYLLSEINAHNSGGWLPNTAWTWINARR